MSEFTSPLADENEIMKAVDINYGYSSSIDNVVTGLKAILTDNDENFVIGGKVKPYGDEGGLNIMVEPAFVFCGETGECVVSSDETGPISFAASGSVDRIDTVIAQAEEVEYDQQSRMYNDPSSGAKLTQKVNTKKKIKLSVKTVQGSAGSSEAPSTEEGWVKLAEVRIDAGLGNVTENNILNVTARKAGEKNDSWTNEQDKTYNPTYLADLLGRFLKEHDEEGVHLDEVIKANNILLGTSSASLTLKKISLGDTVKVKKYDSIEPTSSGWEGENRLAEYITDLYLYADGIINRFSLDKSTINAVSTENFDISSGGAVKIDGVAVTEGNIVLLKDQTKKVENGLYKVSTDAWSRLSGYTSSTSLSNLLFYSRNGNENQGKMFFVKDAESIVGSDEIEFLEANTSPFALAGTFVMRDENGRLKASLPSESDDVAVKENITTLENTIQDFKDDVNSTNESLKEGVENLKATLEKEDSNLQSEIDTITGTTLPSLQKTLEGELSDLESTINTTIKSSINDLSQDVKANASNIETILSKISDLESKISSVESAYKSADETLQKNIDNIDLDSIHIKITTSNIESSATAGDIWLY